MELIDDTIQLPTLDWLTFGMTHRVCLQLGTLCLLVPAVVDCDTVYLNLG